MLKAAAELLCLIVVPGLTPAVPCHAVVGAVLSRFDVLLLFAHLNIVGYHFLLAALLLSRFVVSCLQRALLLEVPIDCCRSNFRTEVVKVILQLFRFKTKLMLPLEFVMHKASFAVRVVRLLRTSLDMVSRYH